MIKTAEYKVVAESVDEAILDQDGLYNKGEYYRYIKKNADAKDEELLFEQSRPKYLNDTVETSTLKAPILSVDS